MVVLLDEVEALAVSRNGASLETNPVDVHRATDAVLAGVDRVAWQCPNVTFVATTNRRLGVDAAFLSRADVVEEIGYPGADAILAILIDTLGELAPDALADEAGLRALADACAAADVDARQVRKLVLRAVCSTRELALDPSGLRVADVAATFALGRAAPETLAGA
jgi:AAA+ superfamily predicted ATPase